MIFEDGQHAIPGCTSCTGGDLRGFGRTSGPVGPYGSLSRLRFANFGRARFSGFSAFAGTPPIHPPTANGAKINVPTQIAPTLTAADVQKYLTYAIHTQNAVSAAVKEAVGAPGGSKAAALSGYGRVRGFRSARFGDWADVQSGNPLYMVKWTFLNQYNLQYIQQGIDPTTAAQMAENAADNLLNAASNAAEAQCAASGNWDCYCDTNYADPGQNAACKNCPQSVFGNCITPPPWTEVGASMRGIPKAHGSISFGAALLGTVMNALPGPADYAPVPLLRIAWTNPLKFGLLMGAASYVGGVGGEYCAQFEPPNPAGFLIALAAEGGDWNKFWNDDGQPILNELGNRGQAVLDFFSSGAPAAVLGYVLREAIAQTNDPKAKVFLQAILNCSGRVLSAIKDPKKFLDPTLWVKAQDSIGVSLHNAANGMLKSNDVETATWISGIADAAQFFGVVVELISGSKQQAWDDASTIIFGPAAPWSTLQKLPKSSWGSVMQVDPVMLAVFGGISKPIADFTTMISNLGLDHIVSALKQPIADLNGMAVAFNQAIQVTQSKITAATNASNAAAAAANAKIQRPSDAPTNRPTPGSGGDGSGRTTGAASPWASVAAGAGAGFLLGGPFGAALGATGGFFLSRLSPKKGSAK